MPPHPVRALGTLVEPLAAAVYFAPEAHERYTALGAPSDFWAAYYASRGACLGETPAACVAAAFGVFNPDHIAEHLAIAWKAATPIEKSPTSRTTSMRSVANSKSLGTASPSAGGSPPRARMLWSPASR